MKNNKMWPPFIVFQTRKCAKWHDKYSTPPTHTPTTPMTRYNKLFVTCHTYLYNSYMMCRWQKDTFKPCQVLSLCQVYAEGEGGEHTMDRWPVHHSHVRVSTWWKPRNTRREHVNPAGCWGCLNKTCFPSPLLYGSGIEKCCRSAAWRVDSEQTASWQRLFGEMWLCSWAASALRWQPNTPLPCLSPSCEAFINAAPCRCFQGAIPQRVMSGALASCCGRLSPWEWPPTPAWPTSRPERRWREVKTHWAGIKGRGNSHCDSKDSKNLYCQFLFIHWDTQNNRNTI